MQEHPELPGLQFPVLVSWAIVELTVGHRRMVKVEERRPSRAGHGPSRVSEYQLQYVFLTDSPAVMTQSRADAVMHLV